MTDSLISRLQSLAAPDRDIDGEIALANGWTYQKLSSGLRRGGDSHPYWRKPGVTEWYFREKDGPPRFTGSLDAALTLKPQGYLVLLRWRDPPTEAACTLHPPNFAEGDPIPFTGRAATPAIALLIAIMKAKEESK